MTEVATKFSHEEHWPNDLTVAGNHVRLLPLCMSHEAPLLDAAADGELWKLKVTSIPGPRAVGAYISAALAAREAGTAIPFSISLKASGQIIGSTRYLKIDRPNRSLEIGHSWLAASYQRSFVNTETKYLLLRYAFEQWRALRVQFITDELNECSRTAILRIGAKQEGIIRRERIMPDGRQRSAVLFSIIDTEWPEVRSALESKLQSSGEQPAFDVTTAKDPE